MRDVLLVIGVLAFAADALAQDLRLVQAARAAEQSEVVALLAQVPEVAEEGRWSVAALRADDPVHITVGAVAAVAFVASCTGLAVAAVRQVRHLRRARRECARLPGDLELAVLDDESPQAFALPGAPGRIVVSRGMLRCLDDAEREVAYDRSSPFGRLDRGLDEAPKRGWTLLSMKRDWRRVFPSE